MRASIFYREEFVADPEEGDGKMVEGDGAGLTGCDVVEFSCRDPAVDHLGSLMARDIVLAERHAFRGHDALSYLARS